MSEFIPIAQEADIPDPSTLLVEVADRLIVLIHAAGHFYALEDLCTHDGGPLSGGAVDADRGTLACPRHGAQFDLKTGAARTMPATKATVTHEVQVKNGTVFVRLSSD